jgi:hypothetical protein
MGGWIGCERGHNRTTQIQLHQAAIALSENRSLGECSRSECGKSLHYYVLHHYANVKREENNYEVIRAARLYPRQRKYGFDPFLLLLQHEDDPKNQKVLPIFWAPDSKGKIRGGQFPPLLSAKDWKELFRKLKV